MPSLELRLRNLETGELVNAELETEQDALVWLKDRPQNMQVLGVATPGLPRELHDALRAAVRRLDPEEEKLARGLDDAQRDAVQQHAEAEQARAQRDMEQHRVAMRAADPNRPLAIHWTLEDGMKVSDPADERVITPEATAAVLAWIAERNEWVKDRGMVVGEATLSVWPAAMPAAAEGQRVQRGGMFTPTAPPAKKG